MPFLLIGTPMNMDSILPGLSLLAFGDRGWGDELFYGACLTVMISVCSYALGLVLGLCGALAKLSQNGLAKSVAWLYTATIRAVPELLIILLIYYTSTSAIRNLVVGLSLARNFEVNGFLAACLSLGVVQGAYGTDVFRSALLSVPKGQSEAAAALGLTRFRAFQLVIFPQMLRHALPALGNLWLIVLKESSLISVVGFSELLFTAKMAGGANRNYLFFFTVVALAYLVLSTISAAIFQHLERRMSLHERSSQWMPISPPFSQRSYSKG